MSYEQNLFDVDTTGTEKMGGFEIYPPGDYPAIMISASKKTNAKNTGAFVECVYTFIDGEHSGKKYTSRLNLWNENRQAVDIAKRELKSLRVALGLPDNASDLTMFVNKPLVLKIGAKPRKDDPARVENNLLSIEPYSGAPAVANPAPQYQPQPPMQQQWQSPQQAQQFATQPPVQQYAPQQPAQMPPPAFQPNGSAPPPWAAR